MEVEILSLISQKKSKLYFLLEIEWKWVKMGERRIVYIRLNGGLLSLDDGALYLIHIERCFWDFRATWVKIKQVWNHTNFPDTTDTSGIIGKIQNSSWLMRVIIKDAPIVKRTESSKDGEMFQRDCWKIPEFSWKSKKLNFLEIWWNK